MKRFINIDTWIDKLKKVIDDAPGESADYCTHLINEIEAEFRAQDNKEQPCKVGDYVYQIDRQNNKINTKKVRQITITLGIQSCIMQFDFETTGYCIYEEFGRTVFTNKVDAMHALMHKTEVKK